MAVIYCPLKYNVNFIPELADLLSRLVPLYDRILIVGDMNMHICCPDKPLVNDFLNITESFNLTQFVSGPTHQRGHTQDLVLGYGLSVSIDEICQLPKFDHFGIVFNVLLPNPRTSETKLQGTHLSCPNVLTDLGLRLPDAVNQIFNQTPFQDSLVDNLNSTLQELLDLVAPVKLRKCHHKSYASWLNKDLLALRNICRIAVRQ